MIFNINMCNIFFHVFIAVLSDEEGVVVLNQNPHQSATTSSWKQSCALIITTHKTSSSMQREYYQHEKELFLGK